MCQYIFKWCKKKVTPNITYPHFHLFRWAFLSTPIWPELLNVVLHWAFQHATPKPFCSSAHGGAKGHPRLSSTTCAWPSCSPLKTDLSLCPLKKSCFRPTASVSYNFLFYIFVFCWCQQSSNDVECLWSRWLFQPLFLCVRRKSLN